jgi:alkylation response protein AidB-like acyl-CoA dehydrogenase
MDFGLSTDQREIQRTARELLAERARPERVREHAESRSFDAALWRELCELGWPGIAIPEEYGGQGLGLVELAILCEELGRSLAPVPLLASVCAAALIGQAGTPEQCVRWLPGLADGEPIGAVGIVRDGVAELVIGATTAQVLVLIEPSWRTQRTPGGQGPGGQEPGGQEPGGYEPGDREAGDHEAGPAARVYAREEAQIGPVDSIDPTRPAGVVRVADGAGAALEGDVAGGIDRALVAIAAELVGVSERALEMTVAYVKERKQFGVPVGAYQAVSHRCAQMLLDTEKARATTSFAAWAADADPKRLGEAAAMAKAAASQAGAEVSASAIQAHGGIGFTWEADVHWLYKRALVDAALLGGAKRQRARLAGILAGV